MVSHENDNAATLSLRVLLQGHQEVHHVVGLGSTIEEVARLNHNRAPAGPSLTGVDQLCTLKNSDERVQITVDVGDRDDSFSGGG